MVGQHIYMRCLNEQKNAGTWTAAVTNGAASRDILLQQIEPKCTLEETFAKNNMVIHSGNNVLRIYHTEGRTVVSRTYWEKDIVTEKEGRRGAYCHGYILTEKEDRAFNSDFEGAFDEACFDQYADVAARANENAGVVTLNLSLDIFRHEHLSGADRHTLETCGIDGERFVSLMTGLFAAVREKKQLAVIMPQMIRDAWAREGDNTTEKVACVILHLLPDYIRYSVGLASHWSCRLGDNMTSGINLIFVHPESSIDLAELKKSGSLVLDVETNNAVGFPETENSFFSYEWENADRKEVLDEFWNYAKQNYLEVIKARPADPTLLEAIYLLKEANAGEYQDQKLCQLAFRKASMAAADAGGVVPVFDKIIGDLLTELGIGEEPLTKDRQAIIGSLLKNSKNAPYAEKLYSMLLTSCEEGTLESGCLEIMCDELRKRGSVSDVLLTVFFRNMADLPEVKAQKDTVYSLAARLVTILVKGGVFGKGNFTLEAPLKECIIKWSEKAIDAKDTRMISLMCDAVSCYLERDQRDDEDLAKCAYRLLNAGLLSGDDTLSKKCEDLLMKEEKGVYSGRLKIHTPEYGYELFKECVVQAIDTIEKIRSNKEAANVNRAFRLVFFGGVAHLGSFADVYRRFVERDPEQIFKAEETALQDVRKANSIWSRGKVREVLSVLESINIETLEHYIPRQQRFDLIVSWYDRADAALADSFFQYIGGLNRSLRESYLSVLNSHGLLGSLLPYLFFSDPELSVFRDAVALIKADRREVLGGIFAVSAGTDGEKYCTNEEYLTKFKNWYRQELDNDERQQLEAAESAVEGFGRGKSGMVIQLTFLVEELKMIQETPNHVTAYGRNAASMVKDRIGEAIRKTHPQDFASFPHELIQQLGRQLQPSLHGEKNMLTENRLFAKIVEADNAMLQSNLRTLDDAIFSADADEEKEALKYRMSYYSEKLPKTSREKRILVNTIAEAYFEQKENALFFSKTYQAQEDDSKVGLLLNVIRDLIDMPRIKQPCIRACILELHNLSEESPKLFNDESQKSFYWQLKGDTAVSASVRGGLGNEFEKRKRNSGDSPFSLVNISVCVLTSILIQMVAYVLMEMVF